MKHFRSKHFHFAWMLAAALAIAAIVVINKRHQVVIVDIPKFDHTVITSTPPSPTGTPPVQPSPSPNATSLLLKVPFTPQAPTANWDTIHNEDCEEASAIMANAYYNGPSDVKLDPVYVEGQLSKLTDWEMRTFGYNLDVTSEEAVKMIEANYNLQAKILYTYTQEDIKSELGQNHLVLIPVNGQLIGNPNYKQPGPKYHMLVIRGYTSSSIITNDPGTRNGLNYSYAFNTLYSANGDWSHASNSVDLTKKNVIVVWK